MIVNSKLPRYISFGNIEVAPNENEFNEADSKLLLENKQFNHYVKINDFEIIKDIVEEKATKKKN